MLSFLFAGALSPAGAFDFQVSNPAVADNLAVYLVDGGGPGGGGVISLEQAMAQGGVKIYQQEPATSTNNASQITYRNGPVAIENLSGQTILLQAGDLLIGGVQDQVVARTTLIPPHSGRRSIETICVDPFRSTARVGENAAEFSAPGALLPWRTGRLSLSTADPEGASLRMFIRDVRQLAVWWSIDSLRSRLGNTLGVALEPNRAVSWSNNPDMRANTLLAARSSAWRNSLPLALENPELAQAQKPYVAGLEGIASASSNAIGAVFVINGQIVGAEIYHSHALFLQMWPKLLRAYATEAVAASGANSAALPTIGDLQQSLAAAQGAPARNLDAGNEVHESDSSIYTVTSGENGEWVTLSYLPKLPGDALTPEGAVTTILATGTVAGRSLVNLQESDLIVLHREPAGENPNVVESGQGPLTRLPDHWSAVVKSPEVRTPMDWAYQHRSSDIPTLGLFYVVLQFLALFVFLLPQVFKRAVRPVAFALAGAIRWSCRIVMLQLRRVSAAAGRSFRRPSTPAQAAVEPESAVIWPLPSRQNKLSHARTRPDLEFAEWSEAA